MTDLAARLRDVLSDETLERIGYLLENTVTYDEARDVVANCLLPLLSSLLEEREREIREALTAIYTALRSDESGEFWTVRRWLDERDVFNDDLSGTRVVEAAVQELLSRLASSSSTLPIG